MVRPIHKDPCTTLGMGRYLPDKNESEREKQGERRGKEAGEEAEELVIQMKQ